MTTTSTTNLKPKRNLWLKWFIAGIVILAPILYLTVFSKKELPPTYLTADVVVGDVEKSVMATGKIRAVNSVNVGAQVSGEIKKLTVKVGDTVKQGDLIAQIDEVNQNNNVLNAEANLSQSQASLKLAEGVVLTKQGDIMTAKANIELREAEYEKAKTYLDRLTSLVGIDAISKKEYDDAASALEVASANLTSARIALTNATTALANARADIVGQQASISKSQNDLSTARNNLGHTTIKAPVSGTVVAVSAEQGTTINANQSAPTIVTLADLSRMRINAQISEADVINIKAGLPAKFNIIGNPDQKFDATLVGIEPAPEVISTTSSSNGAVYYIGYLDVDNKDGKFLIDMTAQVNIIIDQAKNVLTIPSSAIKMEGDKSVVRVLGKDGKAVSVPVEVGINNRVTAEIKSGLNAGDKVVVGESVGGNAGNKKPSGGRPPMM